MLLNEVRNHYKNKLTSVSRLADKQYYLDMFEKARGNINKVINSVIAGPNQNNSKPVTEIKTDGIIVKDLQVIANKFNNLFSNNYWSKSCTQ